MEHRVAICHTMKYTWAMRSIRISDELFDLARDESGAMSRSIAQQLEHWAKIGAALEQADVTQEQVRRILGGDLRVRERVFMKLGLLKQVDMYLIPPEKARSAVLKAPRIESLDLAGARIGASRPSSHKICSTACWRSPARRRSWSAGKRSPSGPP